MSQFSQHPDFVNGEILLFDKPLDWTSFDVVNRVRILLCRKLKIKKLKVGHAGTLDPKATGLVVLCTGKATKKIDEIQAEEKVYRATMKLGAITPSFDLETEESEHFPSEHITLELVQEKLQSFIGQIEQVPPVFSAIKIKGKRAFDYARKGKELELQARTIQIDKIEIIRLELPELELNIQCGKGTYIRSLARDIGTALGSGAYLTELRRTRNGNYQVENAWTMENFEKNLDNL